jgi:hypothetical protein
MQGWIWRRASPAELKEEQALEKAVWATSSTAGRNEPAQVRERVRTRVETEARAQLTQRKNQHECVPWYQEWSWR